MNTICSISMLVVGLWTGTAPAGQEAIEPLRVCATTPNLGSLVRTLGGGRVEVTVLCRPGEDPHFVEARPSHVKALHQAELFVEVGLELEVGWAPVLLQRARNPAIAEATRGRFTAAAFVAPLGVPTTPTDRSHGDVHARGNPHFLLDPVRGLAVARALAERLALLRPDDAAAFAANLAGLRRRIAELLVGEELAGKYDIEKLAVLWQHERLVAFLQEQGEADELGGHWAAFARHRGAQVVAEHDAWTYLLDQTGLRALAFLEPLPGIPPTTAHLRSVVEQMRATGVRTLLTTPYYDPRHADFLVANAGARVARMAHQTGSLPGTDDWPALCDHNLRALLDALASDSRDGGR
jgi:zinc/manganese transport system substrate-binding protein